LGASTGSNRARGHVGNRTKKPFGSGVRPGVRRYSGRKLSAGSCVARFARRSQKQTIRPAMQAGGRGQQWKHLGAKGVRRQSEATKNVAAARRHSGRRRRQGKNSAPSVGLRTVSVRCVWMCVVARWSFGGCSGCDRSCSCRGWPEGWGAAVASRC